MDKKELTCIGCPMGCILSVVLENGTVKMITGNTCPIGESYARKEVTNPTRTLTTTVKVRNGDIPVVSVKTAREIPRDRINACMAALQELSVEAPIYIGDVLLTDVAGLGTDLIATKTVERLG